MNVPTQAQVSAALRHVYTSAATVLAIGTIVAVVPQDQVQPIMDALRQTGDGLQQVFGGVSKLVLIIGPIIAALSGKAAFASAGFGPQLRSIFNIIAKPGNADQKAQVLAATAAIPEVQKIVAPDVAATVPSDKVVAQ